MQDVNPKSGPSHTSESCSRRLDLLPRWERDTQSSEPFNMEELDAAVQKGKKSKSVGGDLTSFELLQGLMRDGPTAKALLTWMEGIRQGRSIPQEWLHTIVTLLPRTHALGV